MITLIYRRSDRLVAGKVWGTRADQVATELQSVLQSELGGRLADYGTLQVDPYDSSEVMPVIEADLTVTMVAPPPVVARRAAIGRARAKLRALGMDADEIQALLPGD